MTGVTESQFVIDDRITPRFRVHRSALADPAVFEAERRAIFDHSWLYVGHESEITSPYDFRTRRVGGRPVILLRDGDGSVRVFVNTCPHRGMQIETRAEGNGRFLKCFYHGWSFSTAGELVALPDEASYGENFDRHNLCLAQPAQVDSYRGFVFLSWSTSPGSLLDYLAGAADYLDLVADQSDTTMVVSGGTHLYAARANWKLLSENSYDGYHALTTHHRYLAMLKASGKDMARAFGAGVRTDASTVQGRALAWDLGHGHAVVGAPDRSRGQNFPLGRDFISASAAHAQAERYAHFAQAHGEDWAARMFGSRNVVIFPNLAIVDLGMGITIRTYDPLSADSMEITAWAIAPGEDHPELARMRRENFLTFWGPAGLATPDDIEALERCQQGYAARDAAPWTDISRGMVRANPLTTDELQMRTFWREWDRRMTGTIHPSEVAVSPRAGRVALPYDARVQSAGFR